MLPPRIVRRVLLGPALIVLTVLAVTGLPVLLIVGAGLSTFTRGRWRPLRLLWMALLYLLLESAALVALFALWVGSGFGTSSSRRRRTTTGRCSSSAAMRDPATPSSSCTRCSTGTTGSRGSC